MKRADFLGPSARFARAALTLIAGAALTLAICQVQAAPIMGVAGSSDGPSGLPIPRFVSLKASRVNVRVGPGEDYKIAWVFTRANLPVEVIQEYDTWRRIRDSDGSVGWVFKSLLTGKRTAIVAPWAKGDPRPIHASETPDSAITAYLEPGVLGSIEACRSGECLLSGKGYSGWISQDQLWGVYPNEKIE